ncbi:hypothetical protein HHI36_001112 [Cryptolaemus montrouzieri]|uniref:Beta-glucosidase n=1 Tax=Cryptolaemus montrouzieri TaxID=559131 RepID=A0ABD2P6N6_9CUCU
MQGTMINFNAFCIVFFLWYNVHAKAQDKFPKYLKFGVATSSFQIEGGWNASGKGESVWDRFPHEHPEFIMDYSNGDVACDSYHLWQTDVKLLKYLGVDHYRFSLSWTRILPTGFSNRINSDGVKYYDNLINSLTENGIEPMVTLYHWDLPKKIQYLGGWANIQTAEYFGEFARIAFQLFGDRVKIWITINEPLSVCEPSNNENGLDPEISLPGIGDYLCGKTVLIAHSKAYHIYDKEFRNEQKGKIGISLSSVWSEPKTNKPKDVQTSERFMQMTLGWFAHPIFSREGDYPEIMKKTVQDRSILENFTQSRLPALMQTEINNLKGSADFFGLNHYDTVLSAKHKYAIGDPCFYKDIGAIAGKDSNWKPNENTVPWGFYKLLHWVAKEYNNPIVYITENGYHDHGQMKDIDRMVFYKEFLTVLLHAIKDGCNIQNIQLGVY